MTNRTTELTLSRLLDFDTKVGLSRFLKRSRNELELDNIIQCFSRSFMISGSCSPLFLLFLEVDVHEIS